MTDDLDRSDLTARVEEARRMAAEAPDAKSLARSRGTAAE